jgi:hypothetical protein
MLFYIFKLTVPFIEIMTDPGIGTYVRYWLHYSNLASSFFKQFGAARKIRDDYENNIISILQQRNIENAVIQINGGQIRITTKREPNQLSLTRIEELISGYYKQRGGKDETKDIMLFIKANRGYSVAKSLKQSGMPNPSEQKAIL